MPISIQEQFNLQNYNTMAVPVKARYFTEVQSLDDLQQACSFALQHKVDLFVLGEGSNTVFARSELDALVVYNQLKGVTLLEEDEHSVLVQVGAGENWHKFVDDSLSQGWFGLENLALIPGLVGAAPIQNIGAYGVEVERYIYSVTMLDISTGRVSELSAGDCEFAYRDSIFKHALKDKIVIISVTFRLLKKAQLMLSYAQLSEQLAGYEKITAKDVFDVVCDLRNKKLPNPAVIPNAGSFFKNPVVSVQQFERLQIEYPDMVSFAYQTKVKLAAAWLIEKAGFKHKAGRGGVIVHQQQALVITNPNKQLGADILMYARQIQRCINELFEVDLQIEPRIYPLSDDLGR